MTGLADRSVLVTRPRAPDDALCAALTAAGARPVPFPTIAIRPVEDFTRLDRALDELDRYAWIAFSSAVGVGVFFDRLEARRAVLPGGARIAAVGPATARAVADRGGGATAQFVPSEFVGERLGIELDDVAGSRVLLPRAARAREELARELTRRGALVDDVVVYHTLPATPDPEGLAALERGVDAATFTSASTVENFCALLGDRAPALLGRAVIACIGPVTAQAARRCGLAVHVEPAEHTMPGLVAALERHFA